MEFMIFFFLLLVINVVVIKISNGNKKHWLISGIIVLVCSPLVLFTAAAIYGTAVESGFGGGAFGIICGLLTFVNGLVFLITGLVKRAK